MHKAICINSYELHGPREEECVCGDFEGWDHETICRDCFVVPPHRHDPAKGLCPDCLALTEEEAL